MKTFKVLLHHKLKCKVKSVPWTFVESFEKRAQQNHSQTLDRLNERGGLSPLELYCLVHDLGLSRKAIDESIKSEENAIVWLESLKIE